MDAKKLLASLTLRNVVNGQKTARKTEVRMGYREAREVARIRQELRERLMSERHEGAGEVLARLRRLADDVDSGIPSELRSEYERWKLRFELLAASARNN
jgi:hypothetical protein